MHHLYLKMISLISGILLFLIPPVYGQWYYSLSLEQEYNSNPFRVPEAEADQVSRFALGIQRDREAFSVQYYGNYLRFNQNSRRNFYWQQLYFSGGDSTNWFLSADNRLNRSEYNLYDYSIFKGGLNHAEQAGNYLIRLGGALSLNRYHQLDELNNFLFTGSASLNRSFRTRTSFIGAVSFNYKTYLNENFLQTVSADSSPGISPSVSLLNGPGGGMGPGNGGGRMSERYYSAATETASVAQLLLSLRAAQSVTTYTGVALQYYNRISLNEGDRSIAGIFYGYDTESQIFDDPMGYQGQSLGLEITRILPYHVSLKASAYRQQKNYISQGIYSGPDIYDENIAREDTRTTAWISLQKRFAVNVLNGGFLTVHLNYQWLENQSNSYWYDYRYHYISGGIDLDL